MLAFLVRHDIPTYLTIIPFTMVLVSVFKLHTSAGVSRRCLTFSWTGSALLALGSRSSKLRLFYLFRSLVTLALFFAVRFKYSLKSERFGDHRATGWLAPLSIGLALLAFWDSDVRSFVVALGMWLSTFAVACQALVTRRTRRITVFGGRFPLFFAIAVGRGLAALQTAFAVSGAAMWTAWLTGATGVALAVDLLYFVIDAKRRSDEFDLPPASFGLCWIGGLSTCRKK
jgi:hypothetical protein